MRQQAQAPTVGDTLTVVHRIAVPAGAMVEPRAPTDSAIATLVGVPDVRREGDSIRVAYTLAVWAPGRHQFTIPGAVVVDPTGRVDTLPDATVTLRVASVLPERAAAESLVPRDARPWLERSTISAWPFLALLVPVLIMLAVAALWWRRRGPLEPQRPGPAPGSNDAARRIERWLDAGEVTLALDHLAARLDDREPAREWRARVRHRRFDPAAAGELTALAREGLALLDRESPH